MRSDKSIIEYEIKKGNTTLGVYFNNLGNISVDEIKSADLKPSFKKILIKLKEKIISENIIDFTTIDFNAVEKKIIYDNLGDRLGDIYKVIGYDSYHSNILIPDGSYLWVVNGEIYYKHIRINSCPNGLTKVASNCNKSKYSEYYSKPIEPASSSVQKINYEKTPAKMAQFGVSFY